jgi:adenosine deaminase
MNVDYNKRFINALLMNDIEILRSIPKSDLHNHFYLGGNRDYLYKKTGMKIPYLKHKLENMNEMHSWVNKYISTVFE